MARRKDGDVFGISIDGEGYYAVTIGNLMAFMRRCSLGGVENWPCLLQEEPLFVIYVAKSPLSKLPWKWLVNVDVSYMREKLKNLAFSKHDTISGQYTKYMGNGVELLSTFEECSRLEPAAIWSPDQVEDRLREYTKQATHSPV